jgi:hypothetical protein
MSSRFRITLIQLWFGPWRKWMPLYFESCRRNPDVRWLMITDQDPHPNAPENVTHWRMSLDELSERFARALELPVKLPYAYKVCDFKVTYGISFADRLQETDFWGMSDLDVVWGRIRHFYSDDLLEKYDVLTSERCSFNGQFTIFRNVPVVNTIFTHVPNYRDILLDPGIHFLDETLSNAAALKMEQRGEIRVLRRKLVVQARYFHPWEIKNQRLEYEEKGHLRDYQSLLHSARWEDGRLYHRKTNRECLLFHFGTSGKNYQRRARTYEYWPEDMTGWTMTVSKIRMNFKPGHLGARWRYFRLTNAGPDIKGRLANVVDTFRVFNVRRRMLKFLRGLVNRPEPVPPPIEEPF